MYIVLWKLNDNIQFDIVSMCMSMWLTVFTWAKYSSEMRPAHSMQFSRGLQGLATSAHLISIRLINKRFSGELRILACPSQSLPSLCFTCRSAAVRFHSYICTVWKHSNVCLTLELVSSMALMGLLMLFTNLLTCSKCRVISVANTMSIMACRRVRNWVLNIERLREFSTGPMWVM